MDVPDPDVIKCRCNGGAIDCSPDAAKEKNGIVPEDQVEPMQQTDNNGGNYLNN